MLKCLILFIAPFSGVILYIVYVTIRSNISQPIRLDIIAGVIFLSWLAIYPLALMSILIRNVAIYSDRLEVNYFFGLMKKSYDFTDLKVSEYKWSTNGVLIQFSDGDQMTLGERQYTNYIDIKQELENRIKKEKIKVKYTTRFTRILMLIGGVTLFFWIIAIKFF